MAHVIGSPSALSDLSEIAEFIGRDSPHYAKLIVQRIVARVDLLSEFSRSGRVVPEYAREDLREFVIQNYRVVYRLKEKGIEIAGVVHAARQLPGLPQA